MQTGNKDFKDFGQATRDKKQGIGKINISVAILAQASLAEEHFSWSFATEEDGEAQATRCAGNYFS